MSSRGAVCPATLSVRGPREPQTRTSCPDQLSPPRDRVRRGQGVSAQGPGAKPHPPDPGPRVGTRPRRRRLARRSGDWGGAKRESPCRFQAVRGSPVRCAFPPHPPGVPPHALPRLLPGPPTPLPFLRGCGACASPHTHVPSVQGLAHVSCQGPHATGFRFRQPSSYTLIPRSQPQSHTGGPANR